MIWFSLALFVVSFIITALLAPKPDFENARASTLDDATFPRATENAPIPLILGRVRMQGPNTIWYGDFQTEAITNKVKTGLFSSETVIVGYKYFLGMDLALALGPSVVLREIWIDDELVLELDTTGAAETSFSIDEPLLFGGRQNGGGFISGCTFYSGSFTQTVNAYVEGIVGTGGVPAYLGTSHLVFAGAEIGESINLRKMAFTIEQYTNVLLTTGDGKVNSGLDINPAEALYQLMIDDWYGLGIDPVDIDLTSLQTAGNTLFAESNGCSIIVTSESDSKRLIDEILRQIDGIMYQDPLTGKIVLELVRNDYVFADLPIFDETDILDVKSFTKTTWDEVRGQVKVSFPQRNSESEAVAVSQDMAVVATTGKLKTTTLGFPFLYDKDLANRIASRERAQISVPLFRATLEINRNANTLRPGSVFRFDWPDYGISDLVMRVQRFDLGSLLKGQIVIEAIQDNFAISTAVFQAPQDSNWENVVYGPTPIVVKRIIQTPRFMTNKLEAPIDAVNYGVTPLALDPASASVAYSLHVQEPGETIDEGSVQPQNIQYRGSGLLTLAYAKEEGFVTGQDTTVGLSLNSVSGRLNSILSGAIVNDYANLIIINDEIMAFRTAVDNGSNNWALTEVYRGLLGTQVADHAMGDRMYSIPVGAFGRGFITYLTGADYDLRVLDVASGITEDAASVTAETVNITAALNVNDKPLRVNNLELGGVRELDPIITSVVPLDLTWNPRDFAVIPIPFETDAAETPTFNESYDIDVRVGGVTNATLSGVVGAGVTTYSVPFDLTAINNTDVEIRVTSIDEDNAETGLSYSWYKIDLSQSPPAYPASLVTPDGFSMLFRTADLFQDAAWSVPVTADGQTVGSVFDQAGFNNVTVDVPGQEPEWNEPDGSLIFDGVGTHLKSAFEPNDTAMTYMVRFQAAASSSGTEVLIGSSTGVLRAWLSLTDGVLSTGVGGNGSDATKDPSLTDLRDNAWHVGGVSWDATDIFLYLDGALIDTISRAAGSAANGIDIYIGARNTSVSNTAEDLFFDGKISDVWTSDRVLTDLQHSEVAAKMNARTDNEHRYWSMLILNNDGDGVYSGAAILELREWEGGINRSRVTPNSLGTAITDSENTPNFPAINAFNNYIDRTLNLTPTEDWAYRTVANEEFGKYVGWDFNVVPVEIQEVSITARNDNATHDEAITQFTLRWADEADDWTDVETITVGAFVSGQTNVGTVASPNAQSRVEVSSAKTYAVMGHQLDSVSIFSSRVFAVPGAKTDGVSISGSTTYAVIQP